MSGSSAKFVVDPGAATGGLITVPGDKSISHRSLMLGAIADGQTHISGFLPGEDCLATLDALRALGVSIDIKSPAEVTVHGVGMRGLKGAAEPLNLGNSGTAMRLFSGLLAGQDFSSVLTGDDSLCSRPMERVAKPLREMGADIETTAGRAPLTIKGRQLTGIKFASPVASAQLKSAILLAGLYANGTTTVVEPAMTRDHTEKMLAQFGVDLNIDGLTVCLTGPQQLVATDVQVPGDLSSATFPLALGILGGERPVRINNVGINPTRTGVLDLLRHLGAQIDVQNERMMGAEPVADLVARPSQLSGSRLPEQLVPLAIDELPMIFALAGCATGETVLRGAEELRHKESDRIAMMVRGLAALGVEVEEYPDGIRIRGGRPGGGQVDSGGDHRIAMAFAVLASRASGRVEITDTANVNTSFPGFVQTMRSLGLLIAEQPG
jgi:3-phosphoshikimate 1-carboxyvinyltransferase